MSIVQLGKCERWNNEAKFFLLCGCVKALFISSPQFRRDFHWKIYGHLSIQDSTLRLKNPMSWPKKKNEGSIANTRNGVNIVYLFGSSDTSWLCFSSKVFCSWAAKKIRWSEKWKISRCTKSLLHVKRNDAWGKKQDVESLCTQVSNFHVSSERKTSEKDKRALPDSFN